MKLYAKNERRPQRGHCTLTVRGLTDCSVHQTKDRIKCAHSTHALVRGMPLVAVITTCAPFQSRGKMMHLKAHSELGCAPKSADHMVSAYDAMDVSDTSILLMLHNGRRSMKGGLCGRPHERTQQPCKRLPKTLSSCARLVHLCVVASRQLSEHHESPRWSQCIGTHVQTSIESVRVIDRLLLIARRHAGEAYRTRS